MHVTQQHVTVSERWREEDLEVPRGDGEGSGEGEEEKARVGIG
jgi:hypothetical protein